MRKTLFPLLLLFLVGCNDKYESLVESAPPLTLRLNRDTLTIRERDFSNINTSNKGMLTVWAPFNQQQLNFKVSDTSGHVSLFYKGKKLGAFELLPVAADSTLFYCAADAAGVFSLDLAIQDQLGRVFTKALIVNSMRSEDPVAVVETKVIDTTQPESVIYMIDAGRSTKKDGMITQNKFLINGLPVITNKSSLQYVFHRTGWQTIDLVVTDDLNVDSRPYKTKILVQ